MDTDPADKLIEKAHAIFSLNSVYEVIDFDREMAVDRLIDFYGPCLDMNKVDCYLIVIAELKALEMGY